MTREAPRAAWNVLALGVVGVVGAGCPSAPFRDHGPRERSGAPGLYAGETPIEGRGLPRPTLVVAPDGALAGSLQHLTVVRHGPERDGGAGPGAQVSDRRAQGAGDARALAAEAGVWVLELGHAAGGAGGVVATLRYRLGAGLVFPLAVGEPVAVRFSQSARGTGLVIWDERGAPTLAVALAVGAGSGRDLGADVVAGLDPEPDFDLSHVAYSEVKLAASGCTEATEHFDLKVRIGDAAAWIPPGAVRRVTLGGGEFDFVSLDTSRPDPRFPPPSAECPSPAHVSWVLLRAAPGP